MTELRESTAAAWIALNRAHRRRLDQIDAALKEAGAPPLLWYDALFELEKSGSGLRLKELEQRMLLAQYNLSRLVDRLVSAGLASKQRAAADGRGVLVAITEQGREKRREAWPVYAEALRRTVGETLSEDEETTLADLLTKLAGASEATAE